MNTLFVCNVFDPLRKAEFDIVSDSPAAFHKVRGMAKSLAEIGEDVSVLSLSEGNSITTHYLSSSRVFVDDISFYYLSAITNKYLRSFLAAFLLFLFVVKHRKEIKNIIFYNYLPEYFFAFLILRLMRKNIIVDIEDGINDELPLSKRVFRSSLLECYLYLSGRKIITVSSALFDKYVPRAGYICYGVRSSLGPTITKSFPKDKVLKVLFSGTLSLETGVPHLLNLIDKIASNNRIKNRVEINITGFGPMSKDISKYANSHSFVNFHGRVDFGTYRSILSDSHIGLVLKDQNTSIGKTTFPSKVVEYTSSGLLLIATRVSDVPKLFSNDEVFFVSSSEDTVKVLNDILHDDERIVKIHRRLVKKANALFDERVVGSNIVRIFNIGKVLK